MSVQAPQKKRAWVKIVPWNKDIATTALESGADAVVVKDEDTAKVKALGVIDVVSGEGDIVPGRDVVEADISGMEDESRIVDLARSKIVIVRPSDWTVIPLENLISQTSNLLTTVHNLEEARTHLSILERGVDGIVIDSPDPQHVKAMLTEMRASGVEIALSTAKVTGIRSLGMGDRVCVDTCTMMSPGEGMLVGSSSAATFLVHSETLENPYVEPRPFRVNAGPVHAYIRAPGDRTRYLSELKSGDEVLIVDHRGRVNASVVGRVKRERRPLLLVEAECDGQTASIILQNAETVRLTAPDGKPVSVVDLRPDHQLLVALEAAGRHFGRKVEETIDEV